MVKKESKIPESNPQNKILIYKSKEGDVQIDIRLENETIWLNQNQIASIFETDRTSISRHINNIFKSGELTEKSNVQFLHVAGSDKPVKFYSLDMIISVGYRVNSAKATKFRIWSNKVLKDYIVKGYAVDEKRLLANYKHKFKELKDLVDFISAKAQSPLLEHETNSLLQFLQKYTKSIEILEQFDTGDFSLLDYNYPTFQFTYEGCLEVIGNLRQEVIKKNPYNNLFGTDVDEDLKSILSSINQTFSGKDLYPSIEEKAAHLLYLIIKDHPFLDGNKRIASMLFIYFLKENNFLHTKDGKEKFTENSIATLSLLIASSSPKEKELMIHLIIKLIQ